MKEISPPLPSQTRGEIEYPRHAYNYGQEELHLRDYWKIVVKRRRLILVVSIISLVFGAYINYTATPMYTAKSILKIEPQNPVVTGVGQLMPSEPAAAGEYFQTQLVLLSNRTLAARVIQELDLAKNKIFSDTHIVASDGLRRLRTWVLAPVRFVLSLSAWLRGGERVPVSLSTASPQQPNLSVDSYLIDRYLEFVSVRPIRSTRLVEVEATTPDPALSQQLANEHGAAFIRLNRETRFNLTNEALLFLDTKNSELRDKLEKSESALNNFRQQYGVVSLDKGENLFVDRLMELNRQLTMARAQRIEAESLFRMVEDKNAKYLSQVINNGVIAQLKGGLTVLEAERARFSLTFKPDHPRFVELTKQIEEAQRALDQEVHNITKGIESNYRAARAREEALQVDANKQQQAALKMKEIGVRYAVLQEEVNVNRTLYESVLKRLSETAVSNDLAVSNMQIVQKGEKPVFASLPRKESNLILGLALGIVLGVALAFALEYFDSSLRNPEIVWRVTSKPTLGTVPHTKSLSRAHGGRRIAQGPTKHLPMLKWWKIRQPVDSDVLLSQKPDSVIADSFRTIRTAIAFSQAATLPHIILVTSASQGEGKTVTSLNLAIAFAQGGKSVLVIDADLRKGRCHRALGLPNNTGLTNVLTGTMAVEESIWPTKVAGLSLLPRGPIPPYPPDLLGSEKMREVLEAMRASYDLIVIDSPPVAAMADAALLSRFSDGVIMVLHGQDTSAAMARQAMERLTMVEAKILGVVLNGVDIRNPEYAYYGGYGDYTDGDYTDGDYTDPAPTDYLHGNGKGAVDELAAGKLASSETSLSDLGTGSIPAEFFDQMVSKLCEAAGPMAAWMLNSQIDLLGETREAFPKARLKELLEKVCHQILNEKLKNDFRKSMQAELKALAT